MSENAAKAKLLLYLVSPDSLNPQAIELQWSSLFAVASFKPTEPTTTTSTQTVSWKMILLMDEVIQQQQKYNNNNKNNMSSELTCLVYYINANNNDNDNIYYFIWKYSWCNKNILYGGSIETTATTTK